MTHERLKKANQITSDISYLKQFLFLNESCSKETRDCFENWKQDK